MISDFLSTLQDNASPTSMAGTEPRLSADSYDMLVANNVGVALQRAIFLVTTAITMNASSTHLEMQIVACTSDDGSGAVPIASTGGIAKALLTLGAKFEAKFNALLLGSLANKFLKARYVSNDGADMVSGAVVAKLGAIADSGLELYASGFSA